LRNEVAPKTWTLRGCMGLVVPGISTAMENLVPHGRWQKEGVVNKRHGFQAKQ